MKGKQHKLRYKLGYILQAGIMLWLLCCGSIASAQLSLQLIPPSPAQLSVQGLFHFTVVNSSQTTYHVTFEGVLSLSSSQSVYTVRYATLDVKPGVNTYDYNTLQVREQYYGSSTQGQAIRNTGIVPYGSYVLCINANDATSGDQLSSSCLEQQMGPLSPPVLLSPEDDAAIEEKNPLLTWMPPTPVSPNQKLTYQLKLVEVTGSESPYDAIMRNPVLFQQDNLALNQLVYPASAYALEYGKRYAWQVSVKDENYDLGKTEVWVFRLVKPKAEKDTVKPEFGDYTKMKPVLDGSYTITISELRFSYNNEYNGSIRYKITDLNGKDMTPKGLEPERKYGDSRYSLPLKKAGKFKSNTFYMLEVYGPKNDRNVLMFKYFKTEEEYNKAGKKS